MEIQLINDILLAKLRKEAKAKELKRQNYDLRTSTEDTSQRMLNVLEPGTRVSIHRHDDTTETVICLEGCLDWIFYDNQPYINGGNPINDNEMATRELEFTEKERFRICPREGKFGIQVPPMTWHSIEVYEPSTIFEAMDGAYRE